MSKKKSTKKIRRICAKCGKKKYTDNMVSKGKGYGRYFQAGKEFEIFECKPSALNPKLCR